MELSGLGGWGCKVWECRHRGGNVLQTLAHAGKFRNFWEVTKDIPQIAGDERPLPPCLVCVHASVVRAKRGVGLSAERSDARCIAQC